MKSHGDKRRESAMKDIKNLTVKTPYFGKINIDSVTREMKAKDLPLLMFMVNKRNGDLKNLGVANGSYQSGRTDKSECSSHKPDNCSFKHVCSTIFEDKRDVATVNFPGRKRGRTKICCF